MLRRALLISLIVILPLLRTEAYTVVMKNGKSMTGTLVSESADVIVFKDDAGVQFSLKKSVLDLDRMAEANKPVEPAVAPPPPPPPPPPPKPKPRTNQPAKVYTEDDINRLRGTSAAVDILEPGVEDTGDPFANTMHSAGVVVADAYGKCQSLAAQLVSVYELAEGSGGDGIAAAEKFIAGVTGTSLLHAIDTDLEKLQSFREQITAPEPGDRRLSALNTLDNALKTIPDIRAMLADHQILSAPDFKRRIDEKTTRLNALSLSLQGVAAVGGNPREKPEEEEPEEEE